MLYIFSIHFHAYKHEHLCEIIGEFFFCLSFMNSEFEWMLIEHPRSSIDPDINNALI